MQTDILIAGGGPVGLCLALLLGRAGFSVDVIEAEASPPRDLRASTFHPPTLDLLEPLGMTARLEADGLRCPHWQIRLHPAGDRAVFDLGVLAADTRHPYRLQCEQWRLAAALRDSLPDNVRLHEAARVTGFAQDADGVRVAVEQRGETWQMPARFLAGCDGARSAVRGALGLEFAGSTYPETTILATTQFPFEQHLEGLSNVSYCWREGAGNFSLLKVPGRWRVSLYPQEDLPLEAQLAPAAMEAAMQQILPRAGAYALDEIRPYRVHMRQVARYCVGRVALAGDAAHVNSPAGGMGLNGGLHDAFELAGAIGDILHGRAEASRLELYDRRRRPVARDEMLAQADRNRARMRERAPERRREMLAELQAIAGDAQRCRDYLLRSSMITGLRAAAEIG